MKSHMAGKHYKKRVEEVQKLDFEQQKKLVVSSEEEDKRIASLESRAAKWRDLMSDTIQESIQYLQKKQSQTAAEMEAERDGIDSDDDMDDGGVDISGDEMKDEEMEERPIYN